MRSKRNWLKRLEGKTPINLISKKLKEMLLEVVCQLEKLGKMSGSPSKVIYYKGQEGLKQVTWNSTNAKDELRVFEVAIDMADFLPKEFIEKVLTKFAKSGLKKSLQLTNHKELPAYTNISTFIDIWEPRYIDPKIFKIEIEMLIYNEVVAIYQFRDKEIFCVEIYNQKLAECKDSYLT